MKRYQFRLEPLLFKRQTIEEQVQQELAEANHKLEEYGHALTKLFDTYKSLDATQGAQSISAADLLVFQDYAGRLAEEIEAAKVKVREQRKVVETVTAKLAKVHMDKEIVEKLKEKDRQQYYEELRKQETKQLDDMTIVRHAAPSKKADSES